jgi:hypothetical protein
VFLGVQILLCRHFNKVKKNGRFWPNAQVHLAECRPQNLATLTKFTYRRRRRESAKVTSYK